MASEVCLKFIKLNFRYMFPESILNTPSEARINIKGQVKNRSAIISGRVNLVYQPRGLNYQILVVIV